MYKNIVRLIRYREYQKKSELQKIFQKASGGMKNHIDKYAFIYINSESDEPQTTSPEAHWSGLNPLKTRIKRRKGGAALHQTKRLSEPRVSKGWE